MAKFTEDKEAYLAAQHSLMMLVETLPHVSLEPNTHNINYHPPETICYLDKEYMPAFESLKDFSVRDYKVINYGRPAVSLTFNTKHKYFLEKTAPEEVMQAIFKRKVLAAEARLVEMQTQPLEPPISSENRAEYEKDVQQKAKDIEALQGHIKQLKDIANHAGAYEFAVSNYYKFYTYTVLTFKYLEPVSGKFTSENAHIVKDLELQGKTITEKTNIIFIDTEAMGKKQPHQHKKIEEFLQTFELRVDYGLEEIFVKKKSNLVQPTYIPNWQEFEKQFLEFFWQYKESHKFRSGPIKAGNEVKARLQANTELSTAFKYICERLPSKIQGPFKKMFRQGYFNFTDKEVIEIALEKELQLLLLLLYESLRFSDSKEQPVTEAKKNIQKRFPDLYLLKK